jgi:hypothetical protein
MKKVLMIAYRFPPMVAPGALRALKFAKYLPEYDWTPVVLNVSGMEEYPRRSKIERSEQDEDRACQATL